jgi:hypothetical protein
MSYVVKGLFFGFLIALLAASIQTAVLFGNSVKGEMDGKNQICLTGNICTFAQSTGDYVKLFFVLISVFAIPAALIGAFVGYVLDRTTLQ